MKRVFIAIRIEPGEEFMKMFSLFKTVLINDNIKWTETSNIHITLVFLGDTEEKRVKETDILLKDICSGFRSFNLELRGAGVFRSLKDPRVLWAGISRSMDMDDLNKVITSKLRETGTHLEERPFSPHLTLGRIKRINNISVLSDLLEKHRNKEIQQIRVSEITFYESILRPEGPIYKPIGRYSLSGR
ncbi:MAG TPA: RNA 2',3'-cyclic phosphodiesterase [Bacteroidales bacterium]|nr:RNA 2',3'-cyclic phosphodiesterase [Bacteroidales bacterium]